MDNFIYSCNDPNVALKVYKDSKIHLAKGGFILCQWQSNSPQVRNHFEGDNAEEFEAKVLGYLYDTKTDTLQVKTKALDPSADTKRLILASV